MSGNYLREALRIALAAEPGTVNLVTVLHDDWCSCLTGTGRCDCNAEIVVRRGDSHDSIKEPA
jgi:hypothetical protein